MPKPASIASGEVPVWNGSAFVRSSTLRMNNGGQTLPIVTTGLFSSGPPVSPNDSDIWIATAPDTGNLATTDGTRWMFQYNATSGSTYKWECVGGTPIEKYNTGNSDAGTAGAWSRDTRATIPLTRAGDFQVDAMVSVSNTSGSTPGEIDFGIGLTSGVAPLTVSYAWLTPSGLSNGQTQSYLAKNSLLGIASSSTAAIYFFGSNSINLTTRLLRVMPKRVA